MTLKTIIKTISNDKVLSILALFSIILIGTLLYYNLSAKLLNNQTHTLEYFEEEVICQPIRELIAYPYAYKIYELKDEKGNIKYNI